MRRLAVGFLGFALAGPALALDASSPMFEAPVAKTIGPDAPLTPKPGDPPGDIAFGDYQRGYYLSALQQAEKRLETNPRDAAAMTLIGEIYHDGMAVPRDDAEAARWWRLAADAGDPQAAYEYGVALLVTPALAAKPDAVSDADARAQYERDKAEKYTTPEKRRLQAIDFASEAEAAAAAAKIKAGAAFADVARARGLTDAKTDLGEVTKSREDFDPAVVDAAFALPPGGVSGPVKGRFSEVLLHVASITPGSVKAFDEVKAGIKQDIAAKRSARSLFLKAAGKGHLGAIYNLGVLALQDDGDGKPDFAAAADYFRRAAEAGDNNAAYSYGVLLKQGKGVPLDTDQAAEWLKRAADQGNIAGQVEYAIMLFNGLGVNKDEAGAARIFKLAAARRNPIAQNRLAHLYVTGRGVPRDLVRAALWAGLARSAGLKDEKLDKEIGGLTPDQVKQVNDLARQEAEF